MLAEPGRTRAKARPTRRPGPRGPFAHFDRPNAGQVPGREALKQ